MLVLINLIYFKYIGIYVHILIQGLLPIYFNFKKI